MKVHLKMIGCRLNQSEIDTMARQLQAQGHEIVADPTEADHFVLNTCAVTNEATKTSRKWIRDFHRKNEVGDITVTGCYAHISPTEIAVLPGVSRVLDNQQKETLVPTITGEPLEPFDKEPVERDSMGLLGRTRAFVKVQDGCDNACTFCVTTVARGEGRSRSIQEVVAEVQMLHEMGYQEIVLTGVHLGSYGYDFGNLNGLVELTETLLHETDMPRIRLSSLEPWDLSENFFELWDNPRICRHLHLPLQSGYDATLRRMRRHTTQAQFRQLVDHARVMIPDVRITTDVIVGFPGETDKEFAISESFIREMDFAGLHVFRYSVRPGTPAAKMKGQVPNKTKKARSARLLALSDTMEQNFAQELAGKTQSVLWEQVIGASEAGFTNVGYTDNYMRVQAVHPRALSNMITPAVMGEYVDNAIQATPVIE